jgi:hypothetical protein
MGQPQPAHSRVYPDGLLAAAKSLNMGLQQYPVLLKSSTEKVSRFPTLPATTMRLSDSAKRIPPQKHVA